MKLEQYIEKNKNLLPVKYGEIILPHRKVDHSCDSQLFFYGCSF